MSTYGHYDAAARVISRTDPGGLTWTRSYESQTGRLDTQKIAKTGSNPLKTFAWFDLDYDPAGNVISRVEKLWQAGTTNANPGSIAGDPGTGPWTYTYDSAGRMLTAAGPNASGAQTTWTYAYDGQGNRLSEQSGSVTETYVIDDQGWPMSMDSSANGTGTDVNYEFDENGGLERVDDLSGSPAPGDLQFAYDSWGGTDSAVAGSISVDYTVDALGRTVERVEGSSTVEMIYAGSSEDLARTEVGATSTMYTHSPSGPLASKTGAAAAQFFLRDLHGDVVGTMAIGAASLAGTQWFSPFGERQSLAGTAPSLGYQGDWTDQSTGTVDMLTRDYLPSLGRFTTRDVLGGDPADPPSLNQYVYTTGSPITYSDPTGMYNDGGGGGIGRDVPVGHSACRHDPECRRPTPDPDSEGEGQEGLSPDPGDQPPAIPGFQTDWNDLMPPIVQYNWVVEAEWRAGISWSDIPVFVNLNRDINAITIAGDGFEMTFTDLMKLTIVGGKVARDDRVPRVGPVASVELDPRTGNRRLSSAGVTMEGQLNGARVRVTSEFLAGGAIRFTSNTTGTTSQGTVRIGLRITATPLHFRINAGAATIAANAWYAEALINQLAGVPSWVPTGVKPPSRVVLKPA